MRPEHAAREGQVFPYAGSISPPGSEPGCRCTAVPYHGTVIDDKPLEPVYPELLLLPILKLSRVAILLAGRLIQTAKPKTSSSGKPENLTEHGQVRWEQRKITQQETGEAIKSAENAGKVSEKIGKYGTLQRRYDGTNGITVIVETEGRNAGKIITYWRN